MDQEVEDLKREVERLGRELDEAVAERNQSAQYGLGLLEETKALKLRCEHLETVYDNTRHELDITQEVCPLSASLCYWFEVTIVTNYRYVLSCLQALAKFQSTHRATTETGIEQEESLLSESAALESSLTLQIMELENETKQV